MASGHRGPAFFCPRRVNLCDVGGWRSGRPVASTLTPPRQHRLQFGGTSAGFLDQATQPEKLLVLSALPAAFSGFPQAPRLQTLEPGALLDPEFAESRCGKALAKLSVDPIEFRIDPVQFRPLAIVDCRHNPARRFARAAAPIIFSLGVGHGRTALRQRPARDRHRQKGHGENDAAAPRMKIDHHFCDCPLIHRRELLCLRPLFALQTPSKASRRPCFAFPER